MPQRCVIWSLLLEAQGSRWKQTSHTSQKGSSQRRGSKEKGLTSAWGCQGNQAPLCSGIRGLGLGAHVSVRGFGSVLQSQESHSPGAQDRGGRSPALSWEQQQGIWAETSLRSHVGLTSARVWVWAPLRILVLLLFHRSPHTQPQGRGWHGRGRRRCSSGFSLPWRSRRGGDAEMLDHWQCPLLPQLSILTTSPHPTPMSSPEQRQAPV